MIDLERDCNLPTTNLPLLDFIKKINLYLFSQPKNRKRKPTDKHPQKP